jgi:hypothetical protein
LLKDIRQEFAKKRPGQVWETRVDGWRGRGRSSIVQKLVRRKGKSIWEATRLVRKQGDAT